MLLGEFDELGVVNTPGTNENHAVSSVVGFNIIVEVIAVDGENVVLGAENGSAERLA